MDPPPLRSGITLQQLQYFLSAVREGSLSAAADAHFIAQPSLSEQIRRLERQLGVTLFVRTNRNLILTDAARVFLPHAERTLQAAETAASSIAPIRGLTGGRVSFGTFSSGAHIFHTELITRFRTMHPTVAVNLVATNSVRIANEVREGRLETAVVALPVDDRGLQVDRMDWAPETIFLSHDAARTQQPIGVEDLTRSHLVMPESLWGDTDPTRARLLLSAQRLGRSITAEIEVESPATALEVAAQGVADTISTYSLAHALNMLDRLQWCALDPPMNEHFGFIKRRGADLSPAATVMRQLTLELLEEIPQSGMPLDAKS